jgi:hypothetical protein
MKPLFTVETEGPRVKLTNFREVKMLDSSHYLVKDIIPNVGLCVVWGAPKCGKSFWVFDLVAHIAAGWSYRDRHTKQCSVVYFALEGQQGFAKRIEAFRQAHNITDIPFYLSCDRIVLPQDVNAVVAAIEAQDFRPGIVVIDTLNRAISGDENSAQDMGAFIRAVDRIREAFNCVVIIIHHCGVEGTRPRGHTALTGATDAQIAIRRDAFSNVVATIEYLKDGEIGAEITSSLTMVPIGTDTDGSAITSCVIMPANPSTSRPDTKVTGFAKQALRILADTINDSGEIPPPEVQVRTKQRTIRLDQWRANVRLGTATDDTTRTSQQKAFVRAVNKLLELQVIGKWENYVWLA